MHVESHLLHAASGVEAMSVGGLHREVVAQLLSRLAVSGGDVLGTVTGAPEHLGERL